MSSRLVHSLLAVGSLAFLAGCAGLSSGDSAEAEAAASRDRPPAPVVRSEAPRESITATEAAAARRAASGGRASESGGGTSADMAKLVDQLNEAARELATLRTANAKLRAEKDRPKPAPAPEPVAVAKPDPAEERLAASLKSYAQFKKDVALLVTEVERLKKAQADAGADLKSAQDQAKQAKTALTRVEDDLRAEKRLRQEAEASVTQLREQLRTIARAMSEAGLSADKLTSQADGKAARSQAADTRLPAKYVVRSGDTMEKIADRFYGDSGKWRLIYDANRTRLGRDGTLEIGMELQIPKN